MQPARMQTGYSSIQQPARGVADKERRQTESTDGIRIEERAEGTPQFGSVPPVHALAGTLHMIRNLEGCPGRAAFSALRCAAHNR